MKKYLLACVIASFLTGCATYPARVATPSEDDQKMQEAKRKDAEFADKVKNINLNTADVGAKPKNYKVMVEGAIRNELKDPDSAKFSNMTTPNKEVLVERGQFVYGYSTCVYVNAKNSYGGYAGKKLYWAFFRDNEVRRIQDTTGDYGQLIFVGRQINCS